MWRCLIRVLKVTVWLDLIHNKIEEPSLFLEDAVTETFDTLHISAALQLRDNEAEIFQQDGVSHHYSSNVHDEVTGRFRGHWMVRGGTNFWPPGSLYLTAPDSLL
jgi:hypothetical protein